MLMVIITALESDDDKSFMLNLYRDYYGLVRKTVYNISRDRDSAEDLTNDTFIKLIEKVSLLRTLDCCKLAAYVVYTSRSVAVNFIKRRNVQHKHGYYGEDADMAEKVPSPEDNLEKRIIHQEEIEELGNAVLKLPEKKRRIYCISSTYWKCMIGK